MVPFKITNHDQTRLFGRSRVDPSMISSSAPSHTDCIPLGFPFLSELKPGNSLSITSFLLLNVLIPAKKILIFQGQLSLYIFFEGLNARIRMPLNSVPDPEYVNSARPNPPLITAQRPNWAPVQISVTPGIPRNYGPENRKPQNIYRKVIFKVNTLQSPSVGSK